MKDYKDTLLMMQTDFPMRGGLPTLEPKIQQFWRENNIYQVALDKNKNKQLFCLHDGPPYANGSIHIGHAANKILKDFVVRYHSMNGYYVPYQPGWDTHGLPIEAALTKNGKVDRKKLTISAFRKLCEQYALEQVATQKEGFKRLGVFADWDHPYITLDKKYEATQLRCFGQMADAGLIYKGLKPVCWSWSSETALAEAEIEYHDVKSPAVYVAFKVVDGKGILSNETELVIWTTTPWTIPANLAICVGPKLEYVILKHGNRHQVIAKNLVENFVKDVKYDEYEIGQSFFGSELEGITYKHPLYDRVSPVILGDHVTLDAGTGLVHTAPGHGADDFIVGRKYNLKILCPVDSRGIMTNDAGEFSGMFYEECSKKITERLNELGCLLDLKFITHSYPHDWRTQKPIIYRATPQWFASIDRIREDILAAIKTVDWVPNWGELRISNMIKDRDDWCISRQRVWGVPIPVFYAEDETAILNKDIINHIANLVEQEGSNVWFEKDAKDLLPKGYTHPGSPNGIFYKETDIMDVWFDSGTSHHAAMKTYHNNYPADVYLEGSDQYRGWFNSSLSIGVALTGHAPYKCIVSHGFALDGDGRKMSKSLGNVIDPLTVCDQSGADILRLWVSTIDYQADFRISKELLNQTAESYRKIRNTFRFMLGCLFDFNYHTDYIPYHNLPEIDKYVQCLFDSIVTKIHQAYQKFAFDEVYRLCLNFMSNELSAFYLDFTKDVLYIEKANAFNRRAIQSVIHDVLLGLACILTPIIPHTTEEVYQYFTNRQMLSIYLHDMPSPKLYSDSDKIVAKYNHFMRLRDDVNKALEEARNLKIIGKSFASQITIFPNEETASLINSLDVNFAQVFIVSKWTIVKKPLVNAYETMSGTILVEQAIGSTCSRCRQVVETIDTDDLCTRCKQIIEN